VYPTPYVAWLRIYEPIEAFDQSFQTRWQNLGEDDKTRNLEQLLSLRRVASQGTVVPGNDGAHVILKDEKKYIAPWSTTQRCWAALGEFKNSIPSSVVSFFQLDTHDDEYLLESDNRTPHILSTTWMIPPRWFSLFDQSERTFGGTGDNAFTVMRTSIEKAKKRLISAHNIVQRAFGPGPVEEELRVLLSWLSIFDPQSIVECDYGGLATYLDCSLRAQGEVGIEADSSIADVADSLQGLSSGDGVLAGEGYSRLVTRWRAVAAYEQAM
jgi:hypothetical protein